MALAWLAGQIYVADAGTGTVKKIRTTDGTLVASFGRFERPLAVAATPDGSLYVADFTGGHREARAWRHRGR